MNQVGGHHPDRREAINTNTHWSDTAAGGIRQTIRLNIQEPLFIWSSSVIKYNEHSTFMYFVLCWNIQSAVMFLCIMCWIGLHTPSSLLHIHGGRQLLHLQPRNSDIVGIGLIDSPDRLNCITGAHNYSKYRRSELNQRDGLCFPMNILGNNCINSVCFDVQMFPCFVFELLACFQPLQLSDCWIIPKSEWLTLWVKY